MQRRKWELSRYLMTSRQSEFNDHKIGSNGRSEKGRRLISMEVQGEGQLSFHSHPSHKRKTGDRFAQLRESKGVLPVPRKGGNITAALYAGPVPEGVS